MSETLKGVKILEVANWVAASSAYAMLADMGAEGIKVEHPETGGRTDSRAGRLVREGRPLRLDDTRVDKIADQVEPNAVPWLGRLGVGQVAE